jgi:hypothetical protein
MTNSSFFPSALAVTAVDRGCQQTAMAGVKIVKLSIAGLRVEQVNG